jgi:thiamine biosynthesis protein ThiI
VASQTLPNLAAVDDAVDLPLLRPLIGLDKAEIVEQAKELGTFDISKLPDEDCCQLFASKLAETRADVETLRRLERLVAAARPVRPGEQEEAAAAEERAPRVPAAV